MQTRLSEYYRNTDAGREADDILRSCVHCGFCTATCPTYQLLGDELDGPRGRIYLIKQVLEGHPATKKTQSHLDRCLTCRACETTCPSGVRYGRLVDIGRKLVAKQVSRPFWQTLQRVALRKLIPFPFRFRAILQLARCLRPCLPLTLKRSVPRKQIATEYMPHQHARKMLLLQGCVQSVTTPNTNTAAVRVLDQLGITLIHASSAGCCGAVSYHLDAGGEALDFIRHNIDAWWPFVEAGVEAIVMTASGCGVMVKEYGELLQHDQRYGRKAARISELSRDISEVIQKEDLSRLGNATGKTRVAFHNPCTLQHGLQLNGTVEDILAKTGYSLMPVADSHLCCGSAGTYSILEPGLSQQLLNNKIAALENHMPDVIATANIGCQLHLASKAKQPVKHWIELLNDILT